MNKATHIKVPEGKKIYFSSDNHLGAPTQKESLPREKKFVAWLDEIKDDAAAIFLLGDLFEDLLGCCEDRIGWLEQMICWDDCFLWFHELFL